MAIFQDLAMDKFYLVKLSENDTIKMVQVAMATEKCLLVYEFGAVDITYWKKKDEYISEIVEELTDEAIDEYEAMDQQEAFDIEYWLLEEAKLRRMPPEKELDRQIHVIIGAGAGIGKETAHRLVKEGAHIVCVDLNEAAAKETADEIIAQYGAGIGVAGTGISNCGVAIGLGCDMTNRESVAKLFENIMLAYGGIDSVIVTAGVFVPPDKSGRVEDSKWDFTFGINVKGAFIVADEAYNIFKKQDD